nr:lysozyme inhibitor LprI family protein [Paracoccus amoyensis]
MIVDVCVLQTAKGETDPDCIGVAAGACQTATQSGSTTPGISACLMSENAVWDRLLNQEYQANRKAFADTPGMTEKLQAAQRAWVAMRDADCEIAYDRYGGGSMRTIASAACQMNHTARRALQLRDMREY